MKITFIALFLTCSTFKIMAQNIEDIKGKPPLKLGSGLSLSTSVYHMQGNEYRQQPFNWFISGTPTLQIYGISIPFSFYLSNQSLGYQQPFNQFGVAPSWKWIKLHAGYSSVHFSNYTLAGRRFLGGGVELNPGKLRFGAVYGRFQEAVEQDSIFRPTPGSFLNELPNGAFARKGYSVKLGVGTDKNYVDLIVLQAADDTTSLTGPISVETIVPERNTAIGIKHRFTIAGKLFWESDFAGSLYTRDQRYPLLDSSENTLPELLNNTLEPRQSSQLLYAGNSQLGFEGKNWRSSIRYRRISRDFKTMGAYYFQTDIEEISTQLSLNLFRRKVMLRGSLGYQRDNLSGGRKQTTNRIIGSAVAGWQITQQLRIDAVYTNFGIQQRNTITGLLDSIRIDQVSSSLQLQTRYQFSNKIRPQSVGVTYVQQSLAPRSKDLQFAADTRSYQSNAFYTLSLPEWRIGLSANLHGLWHIMELSNTSSIGAGLSSSRSSTDGKYSIQSGFQYYQNNFNGENNGNTWSINVGAAWQIVQSWNLGLQIQHLKTRGGLNQTDIRFSETFAQLNMNLNF